MQAQLLLALDADTTAAIVQYASLADQRQSLCTLGTLGTLCENIAREGLSSPSVIVIGDVVGGVAAAQVAQIRQRHAA